MEEGWLRHSSARERCGFWTLRKAMEENFCFWVLRKASEENIWLLDPKISLPLPRCPVYIAIYPHIPM